MNSSQNNKNKRTTTCSILLTMLVATSIITVPYLYRWWTAANSTFSIQATDFQLKPDGRYIVIKLKATGSQPIDVTSILLDGTKISTFTVTKNPLGSEETIQITVWHPWQSHKSYTIRVETKQGSSCEVQAETPEVQPSTKFTLTKISEQQLYEGGPFQLNLDYNITTTGYSWTYSAFFLYKSYQSENLPIYAFYDPKYMSDKTLNRTLTFKELASKYGLNISLVNWDGLSGLVRFRPRCVLILFNPLMNVSGSKIFDASPSVLLDPDEDGFIGSHSAYQKSIIYDWERNNGLVFVSLGSSQAPSNWIIARNGTAYKPRDTLWCDQLLVDTHGAFRGSGYSKIVPTHVGSSLGIHSWGGWWQLDQSLLDSLPGSDSYYVYGFVDGRTLGQPVFIKKGSGGWLFCGDGWNLDDVTIAHDLIAMILHAPWSGECLGKGSWNYDSGFKLYPINGGALSKNDNVSTGLIESPNTVTIEVRALIVSYDYDQDRFSVQERTTAYEK